MGANCCSNEKPSETTANKGPTIAATSNLQDQDNQKKTHGPSEHEAHEIDMKDINQENNKV